MRGRTLFAATRPALDLMTALLRLLPSAVVNWLWTMADLCPDPLGAGVRYSCARRLGASLGSNVYIGPNVRLANADGFAAGDNVSVHRGTYIDAIGGIEIAQNVSIAHECSIISFEHTFRSPTVPIKDQPLDLRPVSIEDDVWVGCGVRILAGAHIEPRTVIAAGSVVRGHISGGAIWAGVPAERKRSLNA